MVDAADLDKMEASRNELHSLLDKPQLAGIPVLVLGNKRDLPGALEETGLIERMWEASSMVNLSFFLIFFLRRNLSAIQDREICCYSISCKEKDNIDITLQVRLESAPILRISNFCPFQWLIAHSKSQANRWIGSII